MNRLDLSHTATDDWRRLLPVTSLESDARLCKTVREIIETVRRERDAACAAYTRQFDRVDCSPEHLLFRPEEAPPSNEAVSPDFDRAVRRAIKQVTDFHNNQKPRNFEIEQGPGARLGERWFPLERVGCYIPGGSAPLVSTLLMTVIPAKIAGVPEILVCTPPGTNARVHPCILHVCRLLGVKEILNLGGAQAVAAMAFGLDRLRSVQKIVGPGNRWVTEAKRQVYGAVDIDMLAGPSEVCILADGSVPPEFAAADLLSQLEHDASASASLISDDAGYLDRVEEETNRQRNLPGTRPAVEQSLGNLRLILARSMDQAVSIADHIAPEHLEILFQEPGRLENHPFRAGAVFFGAWTPVAAGDFFAGTNHVLPTEGRAAFSSPLSCFDFFRRSHYLQYSREALLAAGPAIQTLAEIEQLPAHALSVAVRMKTDDHKEGERS
jgi:histidinol dehydrogenase